MDYSARKFLKKLKEYYNEKAFSFYTLSQETTLSIKETNDITLLQEITLAIKETNDIIKLI